MCQSSVSKSRELSGPVLRVVCSTDCLGTRMNLARSSPASILSAWVANGQVLSMSKGNTDASGAGDMKVRRLWRTNKRTGDQRQPKHTLDLACAPLLLLHSHLCQLENLLLEFGFDVSLVVLPDGPQWYDLPLALLLGLLRLALLLRQLPLLIRILPLLILDRGTHRRVDIWERTRRTAAATCAGNTNEEEVPKRS